MIKMNMSYYKMNSTSHLKKSLELLIMVLVLHLLKKRKKIDFVLKYVMEHQYSLSLNSYHLGLKRLSLYFKKRRL
jgi:hypothetical protein